MEKKTQEELIRIQESEEARWLQEAEFTLEGLKIALTLITLFIAAIGLAQEIGTSNFLTDFKDNYLILLGFISIIASSFLALLMLLLKSALWRPTQIPEYLENGKITEEYYKDAKDGINTANTNLVTYGYLNALLYGFILTGIVLILTGMIGEVSPSLKTLAIMVLLIMYLILLSVGLLVHYRKNEPVFEEEE